MIVAFRVDRSISIFSFRLIIVVTLSQIHQCRQIVGEVLLLPVFHSSLVLLPEAFGVGYALIIPRKVYLSTPRLELSKFIFY